MGKTKTIAEKAGVVFPDIRTAPHRSGTNVPRVGRTIVDSLHYSSKENLFPVPDISQFLDLLPDDGSRIALKQVLRTYRGSVNEQFMKLYEVTASNLNASDDLLIFYTE